MSARAFVAFIAVLAVVGLLGFGLLARGDNSVAVGAPTPDAPLPRLNGEGTATIADYRGRWVLVNFWASWCPPCRDEAPALQRFYERHRERDLVVLGIDTRDLTADARRFAEEFDLTYPLLHDGEGERAEAFGIAGLPESFLVDPRGRIALIRRGPVDGEYLRESVQPLISERETQRRRKARR